MPDPIVPSQNASMSSLVRPADANASVVESMTRSSVLLSQCSPNGVHPIPTMATRSRMPREAMALRSSDRAGLPRVIVDPVDGRDAPEGHLQAVADRDLFGIGVGEFAAQPAAAVEVDD